MAVEAGALRALGQGLAETAADNARAVIEKNRWGRAPWCHWHVVVPPSAGLHSGMHTCRIIAET